MKLAMPFANPTTYIGHSGVDFGEPERTPITASGNGKVNHSGYVNDRAGYGVIVEYDIFPGIEFLYCHQPEFASRPQKNARIVYGGFIGVVGNTGRRSTGPHLHLEVLNGPGAHTYDGVWLYFTKDRVIGDGSGAGVIDPIKPFIERNEMFIAVVNGKQFWLVVPQGTGKPQAVILGPTGDPLKQNVPVFNFNGDEAVASLRRAVNGI